MACFRKFFFAGTNILIRRGVFRYQTICYNLPRNVPQEL